MKFLWTKLIASVVKRAVQVVLAAWGAKLATDFGVTIDQTQLTVGLVAALEVARNYLKHKAGVKFL